MPSFEELLNQAENMQKNTPLTSNAQKLFFSGNITSEEYTQVSMTEQVNARLGKQDRPDEDPFGKARANRDLFVSFGDDPARANYLNRVVREARSRVDHALKVLVPNQIDHVIIRPYRSDKSDVSEDGADVILEVQFKTINVKRNTTCTVGTPIDVKLSLFTQDEAADAQVWRMFDQMLIHQISSVVLQFIQEIKAGRI